MNALLAEPLPPPSNRWSVELLRSLDWKRFQELTNAVLLYGGYRAAAGPAFPDGSRLFAAVRSDGRIQPKKASIFVAGWKPLAAGAREMRDFVEIAQRNGNGRAIYITPGDYSAEAIKVAQAAGIELIDGAGFLRTLQEMPLGEQERLLQVLTAGQFHVPTCPICAVKMQLRREAMPETHDPHADLTLKRSRTIQQEIRCNTLRVRRGADVQFLGPVATKAMVVEGKAIGSFTVDGRLTIRRNACLSGLVTARSVDVEEGGLLDGQASILRADELTPPLPPWPVWGCPRYPQCPGTLAVERGN